MNYSIISGAVIYSIRNESVTYKKKCDNCGKIQGGSTSSSSATITGAFTCEVCKTYNKILIKKL